MAQQTVVNWLLENLQKVHKMDWDIVFVMADQMDKQQKKECWDVAHQAGRFEGKGIAEENWQTFEDYYKETYGRKSEILITKSENK